jgi:hypothetical protein
MFSVSNLFLHRRIFLSHTSYLSRRFGIRRETIGVSSSTEHLSVVCRPGWESLMRVPERKFLWTIYMMASISYIVAFPLALFIVRILRSRWLSLLASIIMVINISQKTQARARYFYTAHNFVHSLLLLCASKPYGLPFSFSPLHGPFLAFCHSCTPSAEEI